jgi:hypothetical protein
MSLLRDIVIFMFALQLAIQVTNHVEIIPGLYLNTGQLSPFTTWYDPLNDILISMNSTVMAFNSINQITNPTANTLNFTIPKIGPISVNVLWSIYIHPDSSAVIPLIGIPLIWFDLGYLAISIIICIGIGIINALVGFILVILMTLFNITVGAIPFYINFFSLVDPVLGSILGVCLGGVQMVVIAWAILEAVPQIQLKGKDE